MMKKIISFLLFVTTNLLFGNVGTAFGATYRTISANGVSFQMALVDGGSFYMGAQSKSASSPGYDSYAEDGVESPVHRVTMSSYWIGKTEVTQALWKAVMGSNPSSHTGNDNYPVDNVTWDKCQTFISKLNNITGLKFAIPTEAQWEYAARGGNQSNGTKFSGSSDIKQVAWYNGVVYNPNTPAITGVFAGPRAGSSKEVATLRSNELGIYDMSGNLYEWCDDWYGTYSSGSSTDPTGPSSGSEKVWRGGCWFGIDYNSRVSRRVPNTTSSDGNCIGLRLVCTNVNQTIYTTESVTACGSYNWGGTNHTTSGTYTHTFTAHSGGDSIVTLNLTINPTYNITNSVTAYGSYTWGGKTYTKGGTYTHTFNTIRGCDSTVTINLTIKSDGKIGALTSIDGVTYKTINVNGVGLRMAKIACGNFYMGAQDTYNWRINYSALAASDEAPVHNVSLSSYWIGQTEVTQALWKAVMGANPSYHKGDDNYPVEVKSWSDCQTFINKLNSLTGCNFALPTEAQWEYAARGGSKSKNYIFAGSNTLSDVTADINYTYIGDNGGYRSTQTTHIGEVASYSPNELGLYDMSGNIWELCKDWYGAYSSASCTDPTGPASGTCYALRGGDWGTFDAILRTTDRGYTVDGTDVYYGLRLVMNPIFKDTVINCNQYTWGGKTYTTSGTYTHTFTDASGCDSIVTLYLTINKAKTSEFRATACIEFKWNNNTYTKSGDYEQHFISAAGCDSSVTLHLTINQTNRDTLTESACDIYTWNGKSITESGNYTDTLKNANGCDSIVTLHLTINKSSNSGTGVTTIIFDGNTQPPVVGGYIANYSDDNITKKGIIVGTDKNDMSMTSGTNYTSLNEFRYVIDDKPSKDTKIYDLSFINKEQFAHRLQFLYGNTKYYIRAYAVTKTGTIYGETDSLITQNFTRGSGYADYENVFYSRNVDLFDVMTDEIINPTTDGFYYTTNESYQTCSFQRDWGYGATYKLKNEWNYKLWFCHWNGIKNSSGTYSTGMYLPVMSLKGNKLTIEKSSKNINDDVIFYYSIDDNAFRPEKFTNVYTGPIEITKPCKIYCYGKRADGNISFTDMYEVFDGYLNAHVISDTACNSYTLNGTTYTESA